MGRIRRIAVVAVAAIALVAALPYGYRAHELALVIAGVVSVVTIVRSMRKYRPQNPIIWGGFGVAASCFTTSFLLRFLFPHQLNPMPDGHPHVTDYFDLTAYVVSCFVMYRVGRLRDDSSDPTTVIDSVILAGGTSTVVWLAKLLPLLEDRTMVASGIRWAIVMTVLSIVLAFCMVRIILTSSQKTESSRWMGLAALFCVLAEGATLSPSAYINNYLLTFGALALVFLTLSARHPSMAAFTANRQRSRDLERFGQVTAGRIALMAGAILIAPAALLWKILAGGLDTLVATCLIGSWAVVTLFVMLRINGLMRVRELIARSERTLSKAASSFVTAINTEDTYDSALAAMRDLVGDQDRVLAVVLMRHDYGWVPADASGEQSERALRLTIEDDLMHEVLDGNLDAQLSLAGRMAPFAVDPYTMVMAAPLIAQGHVRGALVIFSGEPVSGLVATSLRSLGTSVTLAVEAAALSENLHQRRSEQRFRSLVENSPDLILVVDADRSTTFASPAVERLLVNAHAADFNGLLDVMHDLDRPAVLNLLRQAQQHRTGASVEFRITTNNETQWFEATVSDLLHDEVVNGVVFNARNVSERKRLEEDLRHKVLHDSLTGIGNRVLFRERLDHLVRQRRTAMSALTAVLFIDVDDFKTVNDGLGHDIGDDLLKIIAFRLESSLRSGDTAARLGGDEFGVIFEGFHTVEDVMAAANRLLEVIMEPASFGERNLEVSASIGVAIAGSEDATAEILLRNADVAMYHSKQTGKNRVKLFDQAMYVSAFERLELKNELSHALVRRELSLDYQPICSLETNELIGFEALMRWNHPHLGSVPPGSFIPLTEESGLIVPMGAWALTEACRQLADWREEHGVDIFMSVNVSPRQLDDDSIIHHVHAAVAASGIDPSWLTLELTESAGLDDADSRARLAALRDFGCKIAADDFGTGFASYAALQQLPFTNVKIDRSLITGLSDGDGRAAEQVKSIIQMGHGLGLTVTAEGIEEQAQIDRLAELGADRGQGYLLGRPAPQTAAERYLFRARRDANV